LQKPGLNYTPKQMLARRLLILCAISAGVLVVLISLKHFSDLPNQGSNGFSRTWLPGVMTLIREVAISQPVNKIIGIDKNHVFFSVPNPMWIIRYDADFIRCDTLGFGLRLSESIIGAGRARISPPVVFYFSNNNYEVHTGRLNEKTAQVWKLPTNVFTRADRISDSIVVVRALDSTLQQQLFQVIHIYKGQILAEAPIIHNQQLGGFETDGWLNYDEKTNRIYFVEMYGSSIYCLDSTLDIIYNTTTIDKTAINTNKTILMRSDGEERLMPAAPRITINKDVYIHDNFIFLLSGLKADNETMSAFRNNAVVDLYRLADGAYNGSFYLPVYKNNQLRSFAVCNNILVALYKDRVATYRLDL
jgi:hypothetical protein